MTPVRMIQLAAAIAGLALLAAAVRTLTVAGAAFSAVWPISALIVALVVRWARTPREQALVLATCTAGVMLANLATGAPPIEAALLPLINLIEIVAALWVLRRYGAPLDSIGGFAAFFGVAALVAPMISAFMATGVASVFVDVDGPQAFLRWWLATGIGMAVLGPFALTVRGPRRATVDPRRRYFFIGAQLLLFVAAVLICLPQDRAPPLFALYPFLALAAISHIELGGPIALFNATVVIVAATLMGRGPAVVAEVANYRPYNVMQLLLASMVFAILPITALMRRLERYAAELEARRAEAEEVSAIKTRLLAYVSHEIRSPLSGVTGLAQLMHDGAIGEISPAQREILEKIAMTGAEVDALASDLVDAAALQSGRARVDIVAVNAAEAARFAVEGVAFRIAQYEARVELDPCPANLEVAADPLRLRQILVNLLVNAAKYGGRPPRVRLSIVMSGMDRVRFIVADNGKGLAPERRAALFNDFERLGAEKTDVAGSGLGLALSREIARLQDGSLGVDETPDGSRFWLELPMWSAETAAA